jgi:hypothetical protein
MILIEKLEVRAACEAHLYALRSQLKKARLSGPNSPSVPATPRQGLSRPVVAVKGCPAGCLAAHVALSLCLAIGRYRGLLSRNSLLRAHGVPGRASTLAGVDRHRGRGHRMGEGLARTSVATTRSTALSQARFKDF